MFMVLLGFFASGFFVGIAILALAYKETHWGVILLFAAVVCSSVGYYYYAAPLMESLKVVSG